jgi:hypothetical protein
VGPSRVVNTLLAGLCYHAARERTAKAARRACRPQARHCARSVPGHSVTGLARRALALARGGRPASAR